MADQNPDTAFQQSTNGSGHVRLPLESLLLLLRQKGFHIKPDDYIEMLKVIEHFGNASLDEIGRLLCPLIATSEEEQVRFYKIFEEYKKINPASIDIAAKPGRKKRNVIIGVLLAFVALVAVLIYNSKSIRNKSADTEPGNQAGDTCRYKPEVKLDVFPGGVANFHTGDTIVVRSTVMDNRAEITGKLWVINNDTISNEYGSDTLKHRFDSAGDYQLSMVAVVGDIQSPCTQTVSLNFHVENKNSKNYVLNVSQSGAVINPEARLNKLWHWGLLASAFICLGGGVLRNLRDKKQVASKTSTETEEASHTKSSPMAPPYEIPFENNDLRLIRTERAFNEVFRTMRQKTMDELEIMNVHKTILNTIRSGGYPEISFSNQLRHREFLVLFDRNNPKNVQSYLFEYLVNLYRDQNISMDRFFYQDGFQKITNDHFPSGVSLRRLSEIYKYHTLIIIGNCHELVYKGYAVIEKKLVEDFSEWEYKCILTPVPYRDWGNQEKLISSYFVLLPADVEGQQRMIPAIQERQLRQGDYLASVKNWYETSWYDFRDVEDIKEYLQDDLLFQWTCALAVYPKLKWEILVETGHALLEYYHQPEKLNYSNLLKLCRISWMRDGSIPEKTRLDLLKQLAEVNERIARETLLNMFKYADQYYKGGHFFEEEKELQQLTNQFLLFSNAPDKYAGFQDSNEQFRQLWNDNKVLDGTLRLYIDKKPGDAWNTMLKNNNNHVGISEYFTGAEKEKSPEQKKFRYWPHIASVYLLAIWATLYFFNGSMVNNAVAKSLRIVEVDSDRLVPIHVIVNALINPNDTASMKIKDVKGTLRTSDSSYSLDLEPMIPGKDSAFDTYIGIPFNRVYNSDAYLDLTWDQDNTATQAITFQNQDYSVTIRDIDSLPKNIEEAPTRYNPVELSTVPSTLNEIWRGQSNRRLLAIDLQKKLLYYSTGDKSTYGTYHIEEVYYYSEQSTYKIITRVDNQFLASFIKNIQATSFEFSLCPDRVNSKEEAVAITENSCNESDVMIPSYDNEDVKLQNEDNARVKLPHVYTRFKSDNLTSSQRKKLQGIMSGILDKGDYGIEFDFVLNKNSFYSDRPNFKDNKVITELINFASSSSNLSVNTVKGGPFDRDVLLLKGSGYPSKSERNPAYQGNAPEENNINAPARTKPNGETKKMESKEQPKSEKY